MIDKEKYWKECVMAEACIRENVERLEGNLMRAANAVNPQEIKYQLEWLEIYDRALARIEKITKEAFEKMEKQSMSENLLQIMSNTDRLGWKQTLVEKELEKIKKRTKMINDLLNSGVGEEEFTRRLNKIYGLSQQDTSKEEPMRIIDPQNPEHAKNAEKDSR